MSPVLGWELDEAVALLQRERYTVTAVEVRSKKGQEGNERRVIRQQLVQDGEKAHVFLAYAVFRTQME